MAWNDERVEMLKQLWAEGLSASQIAGKMGGVTRNAVIGKVHRLGLSGRATPAKPQRGRTYEADFDVEDIMAPAAIDTRALIAEPAFTAPFVHDGGDRTTVSNLSKNMCRWPMGDPATDDFHFCGQSTPTGKSYCAYHARLAFQPSHRRTEPKIEPQRRLASADARRRAG